MISKLSHPLSHSIVFFELLPSIYIKSIYSCRKISQKKEKKQRAPPPPTSSGSKTASLTRHVSFQGCKHITVTLIEQYHQRKVQIKWHSKLLLHSQVLIIMSGFPWCLSGEESPNQCRGQGFNPWSRKIPHATEQLSPCATTTEPMLWSLGATTTEPTCLNY